jgi:hypothetical protein
MLDFLRSGGGNTLDIGACDSARRFWSTEKGPDSPIRANQMRACVTGAPM